MTDPNLESLNDRVNRLERQNWRLKVGMLIVLLMAFGGCVLSVAVGRSALSALDKSVLATGEHATGPSVGIEPVKRIEAEEFVMRDAEGRARATLGFRDDAIGLAVFDAAGARRLALGIEQDGRTGLFLDDAQGESRAYLILWDDGRPHLQLLDSDSRPRAGMGLHPGGESWLSFDDAKGNGRFSLADHGYDMMLAMYDTKAAMPRAQLRLLRDGSPTFILRDENSKPLFSAP